MNKNYPETLLSELAAIPEGHFISHPWPPEQAAAKSSQAVIKGRGRALSCPVMSGLTVCRTQLAASKAVFHHEKNQHILKISYCHAGRIGWYMQGGAFIYLGSGDMALHTMTCCADSEMNFPLGYYDGLTITADLAKLAETPPPLAALGGFDAEYIYDRFCTKGGLHVIAANSDIEHIFAVLYTLPPKQRLAYYTLKAQELLLYLCRLEPAEAPQSGCPAQQTDIVRAIHQLLTENLAQRFTIDELTRRYPINSSSLKAAFKTVYGQPIATYMKEYRIREAMRLLRSTDTTLATIAAAVGYETQSKFTKAFKDIANILPSEYRRRK